MALDRIILAIAFLSFCIGCSSNSIYVQDPYPIIAKHEQKLKKLRIGVVENRYLRDWNHGDDYRSGEVKRAGESRLFARYLRDEEIFGEVTLVNSPYAKDVDYVISYNVDVIYNVEWSVLAGFFSIFTLGFLPYDDASAMYTAQATIYERVPGTLPMIVSGSLAENFKEWRWDNFYWDPDIYYPSHYEPLFEQLLYDFITRSGCLRE